MTPQLYTVLWHSPSHYILWQHTVPFSKLLNSQTTEHTIHSLWQQIVPFSKTTHRIRPLEADLVASYNPLCLARTVLFSQTRPMLVC